MDASEIVQQFSEEIIDLSRQIYNFAELGSAEYQSSALLTHFLEGHGFIIQRKYLAMETAFRAEFGISGPTIGLLAEYDALPNGHSCGHNLISAWACGVAVVLSKLLKNCRITVFGTPSEEGIGIYAGSKVIMADKGAFNNVDFVMGMHPDDKWSVGSKALSDIALKLTFHGKSAHLADSPELGINALDAAVTAYGAINSLRGWAKNDKHVVIGMIFRESGTATNVVPDLAVLEVDMRSTSGKFLPDLVDKVKTIAEGISKGYGTTIDIEEITPLYEDYLANTTINKILHEELQKLGIQADNIDLTDAIASGSTDEANVSKSVPTGHIDVKIGTPGIAGHSDEFREAANPEVAGTDLLISIVVASEACRRMCEDPSLIESAKEEFEKRRGEIGE